MIKESINISVFAALKVSEKSKVPTLLMSNPGIGKSTTVAMFAETRGYHLQLLRGNSTTAEEVLGYDVADTSEGAKATKHLRPSWFAKVLEVAESGQNTLLFLDEITTANEYVQSALLHLVFERMVGDEHLPKGTLIVSAGNYSQNLSNQMTMLPPLMNRFMIYNITPVAKDLDTFLCKYRGSLMNGTPDNYMGELKKTMIDLDNQEVDFDESQLNKIGEYIETGIRKVTEVCIRDSKINLAVTELQGIYNDTVNDSKLYGFVTFRTLNYLRDVTIATYKCFGKEGISSDNFRNMIDGLCGIGISRVKQGGEIKATTIGSEYQTHLISVANELEKMKNTSIPTYENFFNEVLKGKKKFENSDVQAIINKISELVKDKSIDNIDRPVSHEQLAGIFKIVVNTCKTITNNHKLSDDENVLSVIGEEKLIDYITFWNNLVNLVDNVQGLVTTKSRNYESETIEAYRDTIKKMKTNGFQLKTLRQLALTEDAALGKMIPEVKSMKEIK